MNSAGGGGGGTKRKKENFYKHIDLDLELYHL